jgi:hypothetical protein
MFGGSSQVSQSEYNKKFSVNDAKSEKLREAFRQVADIRKFEIELYWRRATYFWALIAVAFAGYFGVLSGRFIPNKFFLSVLIAGIGFVFTFAWHLANRGSKYWQENWENHLDLLEDNVTGPLYKTLLERPEEDDWAEKYVTGPKSVSVSKINQWVSVYVLFTWLIMAAYSMLCSLGGLWRSGFWSLLFGLVIYGAILYVVKLCCKFMLDKGKTHKGHHGPNVRYRTTEIDKSI